MQPVGPLQAFSGLMRLSGGYSCDGPAAERSRRCLSMQAITDGDRDKPNCLKVRRLGRAHLRPRSGRVSLVLGAS